jgi:hypothetical protein
MRVLSIILPSFASIGPKLGECGDDPYGSAAIVIVDYLIQY